MARWFVDRSAQQGIPSVSLRRLLPGAQFVGCRDLQVSGCSADSRRLDPGQVYVAARPAGPEVRRALDRGAVGVVAEEYQPEAGSPQVVVADAAGSYARVCQALAGDPSRSLQVVAVTGRAGKTAASRYLRSIFEADGRRCGLVTPLGWSDGVGTFAAALAGPGADGLAEMLNAMVARGCRSGVIELPDNALADRRFEGLAIDTAIAIELGDDPEPTPGRPHGPRSRAARLFRSIASGGLAVVNADDPACELLGAVNLGASRIAFGLEKSAEITGTIEAVGPDGTTFTIHGLDREASVTIRGLGIDAVRAALAAAAAAYGRGVGVDAIEAGIETVAVEPGRLEVLPAREGGPIVVLDRSRTGVELSRSLAAVRMAGFVRIVCVVGAEGHGRSADRHALAEAAEAGADQVVLTTDSPRGEDPEAILDDLLAGFRSAGRVLVEPDRRRGLESAVALARPGEAVLVAGRGRSGLQIFADHAAPFDDAAAIAEALDRGRAARALRSA